MIRHRTRPPAPRRHLEQDRQWPGAPPNIPCRPAFGWNPGRGQGRRPGGLARGLLPAALAVLLAGCVSVGPDYKRPQFDAPQAWNEAPAQSAAAQGLEQAAWWKAFGDPVLDELMIRAVEGNQDVAQARARIAQARARIALAWAAEAPPPPATPTDAPPPSPRPRTP